MTRIYVLLIVNIILTLYLLYNVAAVEHLIRLLIEALGGGFNKEDKQ